MKFIRENTTDKQKRMQFTFEFDQNKVFRISTELRHIDIDFVWEEFQKKGLWENACKERFISGLHNARCYSVHDMSFEETKNIALIRVVTDYAVIAVITDLIIHPEYMKFEKEFTEAMIECVTTDPDYFDIKYWLAFSGLYHDDLIEKLNFKRTELLINESSKPYVRDTKYSSLIGGKLVCN